jgi:mycofactocin system transcriptional regulator
MAAIGRPPSTTHAEIEAVAFELFQRDGFEATSVEDIAAAVGVERRTIFRYFPSKNDMVWGDFGSVIDRLRQHLEESEDSVPLMDALRRAAVLSNRYPEGQLPALRLRMTLITTAPALQANSMLRYSAWRRAIAEWAAARLGKDPSDLVPEVIAQTALGASMAAFTRWVHNPGEDLEECVDGAYRLLAEGFPSPGSGLAQ